MKTRPPKDDRREKRQAVRKAKQVKRAAATESRQSSRVVKKGEKLASKGERKGMKGAYVNPNSKKSRYMTADAEKMVASGRDMMSNPRPYTKVGGKTKKPVKRAYRNAPNFNGPAGSTLTRSGSPSKRMVVKPGKPMKRRRI